MARVRTNWYGENVKRKARRNYEPNLDTAAEWLRGEIVKTISTKGPPRSAPSMPPHVATGNLRRNINWAKRSPGVRAIGTGIGSAESVGYAAWLEFGTRRMAKRPYLRPAIRSPRNRKVITKILSRDLV